MRLLFHRISLTLSSKDTKTLILLHTAVFLAGWTGIFGRLISLGGLPLVWYRIMVSVAVLAIVLAIMGRLHKVGWKAFVQIAGCGGILALHWVAFYASIQASNVSIGVACIALIVISVLIQTRRVSRNDMIS